MSFASTTNYNIPNFHFLIKILKNISDITNILRIMGFDFLF